MKKLRPIFFFATAFLLAANCARARETMLIVVGAAGEAEYGAQFSEWSRDWQQAAKTAHVAQQIVLPKQDEISMLRKFLSAEEKNGSDPFWIVLIGHGTFDGEQAKFNLEGDDLSARELKTLLAPMQRPIVLVDLSSASAPFLAELSGPRRVIVTATRTGSEKNFAHFGNYFSKAITSTAADLDKDGQTSVLEAFLFAAQQTSDFFETEQRIATEHALIDDNGDGRGTPANAFERLEPKRVAKNPATPDGARAREIVLIKNSAKLSPELEKKRKELEAEITKLRQTKTQISEDDYYHRLETLLLDLARLDQRGAGEH